MAYLPTTITPVRGIPALTSRTTPSGEVVLQFDGFEPKRTRRSYEYLVVTLSWHSEKWSRAQHAYVPCKPQVIISKGTGNVKTAERFLKEHRNQWTTDRFRIVVLRAASNGTYRVWAS